MCLRSRLLAALVALLVAPSLAPARVIHFTCRDGVLVRRLSERRCRVGEIGPCGPLCDADQTCNGVCTFVLPICPPVGPRLRAGERHRGGRGEEGRDLPSDAA